MRVIRPELLSCAVCRAERWTAARSPFTGPAVPVHPGNALHLTSLGHNDLILAALEEKHSYSDFEAYLEESPDAITERPSWVTEIVTLELEHGGGERDGISEELDFPEGTYALICIHHRGFAGAGPTAKAIGEITASSPQSRWMESNGGGGIGPE